METDIKWFDALYEAYADAIFRYLFLQLGDRERAKELMQDVFMRAWQYRTSGKLIEYEKAWLYRAAHNSFVNEIRTDKRTYSIDSDDEDEEGAYQIVDESMHTDAEANHQELLHYLHRLKESYRTVLMLRYIDGLEVIEIARLLEENETTISMRIKRALEKLRLLYETAN